MKEEPESFWIYVNNEKMEIILSRDQELESKLVDSFHKTTYEDLKKLDPSRSEYKLILF